VLEISIIIHNHEFRDGVSWKLERKSNLLEISIFVLGHQQLIYFPLSFSIQPLRAS
jgi:hypothetical protein